MDKTNFSDIFNNQIENKYYTPNDLKYSNKANTYLSPYDYQKYLDFVDDIISSNNFNGYIFHLESFNSKHIYYISSKEFFTLLDDYINILNKIIDENNFLITPEFEETITNSRIYSEIEGSINIENVPTTRKRLVELIEKNQPPKSLNDIIITNMSKGINFVKSLPEFNKQNLLKLYQILSSNCLKDEDVIKPGLYYRDDEVEIDNYKGCPSNKINQSMDSLFIYANKTINNGDTIEKFLLPHVCHYYILYIHPYFDYNGRTARMVSLWINLLLNQTYVLPPLISEAINQTKKDYYNSLRDTRNARNDLSYFFLYIFKTTIKYILCYRDLEYIDQYVKNQGEVLTKTELNYIKRILITYKGQFVYKSFISNCQIEITKQGAFKILNKFVKLKILTVKSTTSKTKLFDINKEVIKYTRISN